MNTTPKLKRDNHFLPVCYQKGFADSTGRVWVRLADREKAVHWHPRRVGKQLNFYVRDTNGVEDDKFENFFDKQVENSFGLLSRRVKQEQNHFSELTGKEQGALYNFVASQLVRTCANKRVMEEQVGRILSTNEFLTEMARQMLDIVRLWKIDPPRLDFYTTLPYVEEHFITGDNPVLVVQKHDNNLWAPTGNPKQEIEKVKKLLTDPMASLRVALSPYICVFLDCQGGGDAQLPPHTMEPSTVRGFNSLIHRQCELFTLARDEESLP